MPTEREAELAVKGGELGQQLFALCPDDDPNAVGEVIAGALEMRNALRGAPYTELYDVVPAVAQSIIRILPRPQPRN